MPVEGKSRVLSCSLRLCWLAPRHRTLLGTHFPPVAPREALAGVNPEAELPSACNEVPAALQTDESFQVVIEFIFPIS